MLKKCVSLLLLVALVVSICTTAFADRVPLLQRPLPAQVVKTIELTEELGYKYHKPSVLYVRHYLWSDIPGYYGDSKYTNYFQAVPAYDTSIRYGGNWMAPDTANYVRSSSITTGHYYSVAGRANTKYADAGFSSIRISGYMDSDN